MKVGVPKETAISERRVALVPETVGRLVKGGVEVLVQRGAGEGAFCADELYRAAGATLVPEAGRVLAEADIVVKVQRPAAEEAALLRAGTVLISFLQAARFPELVRQLAERRVTAFSMERVPRLTRAQSMDALSSQATVAGYKAGLVAAEAAGGYAAELGLDQQRRELELIHRHIREMDLVITTALIPGRPAPRLITRAMVRDMRAGAVIVDLAAEAGGNCELTRPDETVREGEVTVLGPLNLPTTVPLHASQMYSRNLQTLLQHLVKDGALVVDLADEITGAMVVTHQGEIRSLS